MRQLLTTESGSVYDVDTAWGFWMRNGDGNQRIWDGPIVVPGDSPQPRTRIELDALLEESGELVDEVKVGQRVYLAGRDSWAFSTVIVKVENVESKPAKEES